MDWNWHELDIFGWFELDEWVRLAEYAFFFLLLLVDH